MKLRINLDDHELSYIRLYVNVEYILTSSSDIFVSTSSNNNILYSKCIGNGTTEVYMYVTDTMMSDTIFLNINDTSTEVKFLYKESVLSNHLHDIVPAYLEEEYPLLKKLLRYYFDFLNIELNASNFIHNMEKYRDIDETFDEFVDLINKEYLPYFSDVAVDERLLSKYIIQFYNQRGTEDSIRFLLRVLFNKSIDIVKQRNNVLIASDIVQGIISKGNIVLADNYYFQLYSYIIDIDDQKFRDYKDIMYKTVNPTGYLPFGRTIIVTTEETIGDETITITSEKI